MFVCDFFILTTGPAYISGYVNPNVIFVSLLYANCSSTAYALTSPSFIAVIILPLNFDSDIIFYADSLQQSIFDSILLFLSTSGTLTSSSSLLN